MFGLDTNLTMAINLLVVAIVLIGFFIYLVRLATTVTKSFANTRDSLVKLQKIEDALPLLEQVSKEFFPDHQSTLKDALDRLESLVNEMHLSIERLIKEQGKQAIDISTNARVLSALLVRLNRIQEEAAHKGEVEAAVALQKLITELVAAGVHTQPFNVNISNLAQGASSDQVAVGKEINQQEQK